jgi:nucleoside-diphosphate-sugar epimerase|tara:strand:- start:101 stop:1117 length:1017 start_codon:yes stop_codon:yes gene_type:complete
MKVLVTGNLGYVGNVLTEILSKLNFQVIGCDSNFYPQKFLTNTPSDIIQIVKDIRTISADDLDGVSHICHLAALSNDPLGEINPNLTNDINYLATVRLAKLAKKSKVERFIFSSSCSSYGANDEIVDENSPLAPITSYAKSKVNSEKEILELNDDNFMVTNLRSATAYGLSNSLRLDLVVNNLTCSAFTTKKVNMLSDGTSWRPLVHVEDMANAFISVLNAEPNKISGETFNVGNNEDNYKVHEIADKVHEIVPNSEITYAKNANKDTRSYRVDFNKIKNQLGYKTKWTLKKGIESIYENLKEKNFSENDFKDKKYYRVKYLNWLMNENTIDSDLFIR